MFFQNGQVTFQVNWKNNNFLSFHCTRKYASSMTLNLSIFNNSQCNKDYQARSLTPAIVKSLKG